MVWLAPQAITAEATLCRQDSGMSKPIRVSCSHSSISEIISQSVFLTNHGRLEKFVLSEVNGISQVERFLMESDSSWKKMNVWTGKRATQEWTFAAQRLIAERKLGSELSL